MRTTLKLDDDLLIGAKARAAKNRTTPTAVIEDALRDKLTRRSRRGRRSGAGRGAKRPAA
jgi:hypothetical protein